MIDIILCILQIRVGRNIIFPPNGTTGPEWTLEYINNDIYFFGLGLIIGGVVAGSVVVIILIAILLMVIIFLVKRTNSLKKA